MAKKKRETQSDSKLEFLQRKGVEFSLELIKRATIWELEFKAKLEKIGVVFVFQHPVICNKKKLFILDFYLPEYQLAFELDGAHHYEKTKLKADATRSKMICSLGIQVKRIMNRNVKQISPEMLKNYLETTKLLKSK